MRFRSVLLALAPVMIVTACSSASATRLTVTGTDDACTSSAAELPAGKVTIDFTNQAADVSELYVLREDETVVGEVENVTTGTKRSFTVSLVAGEYHLVCKPGQKGDGIRSEVNVSGTGGEAVKAADRSVAISGKDYAFDVPASLAIKKGEVIRFVFKNDGKVDHEMEIIDANRQRVGEVGPTKPGAEGEATMEFAAAGDYTMICTLTTENAAPHDTLGMHSLVKVTE